MRDFREIFRNAVRFEPIRFGFERFKTRQKALWDKDFKGTEMSQVAIKSPELTTILRSLENRLGLRPRGFESHTLRHKPPPRVVFFFYADFARLYYHSHIFPQQNPSKTIDKQLNFMYNVFVYLCAPKGSKDLAFLCAVRKSFRKVVETWHSLSFMGYTCPTERIPRTWPLFVWMPLKRW